MPDFTKPTTEYKVRVLNTSGVLVAEFVNFWSLAYRKAVNEAGLLTIDIDGDHSLVDAIGHKYQVEVWRRNLRYGLDWYRDFSGLFLGQERYYTDKRHFRLLCPGDVWLLSTRGVMWAADTANRSAFTSDPAETVMKTLVDYNAGPNATAANSRERDGAITGLSIQTDGANGNTIDWYCAWRNLLQELQAIARIGGGDFDLIKTGATTYEFRWYTGQRGTDRTASVLFALEYGNMKNPRYTHDRVDEKTVAVVAGEGQESNRTIVVRTGDDYSASNDVETYLDGRRFKTTAGLQSWGDDRLDQLKARQELEFDPVQVEGSIYGLDYCVSGALGDLVKARYDGIEVTKKIAGVSITLDKQGDERVDLELETQ